MIAGFGYRRFDKTGEKPIFNFGHGLSYTTFSISNLAISDT
jgi:beta-glucosidase